MNRVDLEPLPDADDLAKIGANWELQEFHFIRKMENIVYSCQRNGEKVFLRLTSPLRRSRDEIVAELDWIEFLTGEHIPVARPVKSIRGDLSETVYVRGRQFEACVFREILGEHPTERIFQDGKFLFDLGVLLARMHEASLNYSSSHRRENWYEERGLRHAREAARSSKHTVLRNQLEKSIEWMKNLSKENYGLIHADCGPSNLFIQPDGTISLIDFDDCCYHWFAFDVAFVVYSLALNSCHEKFDVLERQWLENLLSGYRSIRVFSERDEKLIPRFVEFACLRIIFWIEYHENLGTFRDEVLLGVNKIKQWAIKRVLGLS
ncbi:MAG: Homoserine kinase [bacterium ADurb.BinA186]|nr:MAG: Homoserine kinase [bacterium ADurb.BinA186]